MRVHYGGHFAAYLTKTNAAMAELRGSKDNDVRELAKRGLEEVLRNLDKVPEHLRATLRNQGGGFINHELYFSILAPQFKQPDDLIELTREQEALQRLRVGGLLEPDSAIAHLIDRDFGGVQQLQRAFDAVANGLFGSGWVWLEVAHHEEKGASLRITTTANQDNPIMTGSKGVPILGEDLWEHAYYLDRQNRRAEYVSAFWHVLNWGEVNRRLLAAVAARGWELRVPTSQEDVREL